MKYILDKLFGEGATLKRETVIFCWAWISFMIIRVFVFVSEDHVRDYEYIVSGTFWPIVVLLGAIFGIQLAPYGMNRGSRSNTEDTFGGERDNYGGRNGGDGPNYNVDISIGEEADNARKEDGVA